MTRACLFVLALASACATIQDTVEVRPLSDEDGDQPDCDKACASPGIHSVNYCSIATEVRRPYLVCELTLTNRDDPWEAGIEPPRDFDPQTRGEVDLAMCSYSACAGTYFERMGERPQGTVTGCRVAERPPARASVRFLVCSVRTKTGFSVQ